MFTVAELAIASAVAFGAGGLQGSVGFGFAIVAVPVLSIVDQRFAPVPVLMITLVLAALASWRERDHLDVAGLGWIISGRIPGSIAGAWVVTVVARDTLSIIIASAVLIAVALLASGLSIAMSNRNRVLAGVLSGFSGTSVGIGGPPLALLYRSSAGGTTRSSLGAIFTIGIAVNILALAMVGAVSTDDWIIAAQLAPTALLGFGLSTVVKHRFDGQVLRWSILTVAGIAGLVLLIQSI